MATLITISVCPNQTRPHNNYILSGANCGIIDTDIIAQWKLANYPRKSVSSAFVFVKRNQ